MLCVSEWYTSLGNYTFPTVFIRLSQDEIKTVVNNEKSSKQTPALISKIQRVIEVLPGKSFIYADCCAPTDSTLFQKRVGAVNSGVVGWQVLTESAKVREAFRAGQSERICLHPYRRMAPTREFRMFIKDRELVGMSQLYLDRHHPKVEQRKNFIWRKARALVAEVVLFLPAADIAVDVYLTSGNELMIIDMNVWGPPTDSLLYRTWDCDWKKNMGLRLATKPVTLKGEVSVSF